MCRLYNLMAAAFIAALVILTGCKCGCNVEQPPLRTVHFVNFSQHEVSPVLVKIYNPNVNFTGQCYAFTATSTGADSSYYINIYGLAPANSNYDFNTTAPDILIYLPTDSLTYQVSDITFKSSVCQRCGIYNSYTNFVSSYAVNNNTILTTTVSEITITK